MFKRLKTDNYQVWFSTTKNCAFLLQEDISELSELIKVNHCKSLHGGSLEITLTVPSMWGGGQKAISGQKKFLNICKQ